MLKTPRRTNLGTPRHTTLGIPRNTTSLPLETLDIDINNISIPSPLIPFTPTPVGLISQEITW